MTVQAEQSAAPRRRREDWEQSRTLLNMVRSLMPRPSGDEIAQQLVLNLLAPHRPKSVVICLFGGDGALHSVGSFGVSATTLDAFKAMSLWDASPMADAIRANDTILLDSPEEMADRYPWLLTKGRTTDPIAVTPLALMNQQVGALQITFAEPPNPDTLISDLAGLTAVLALYMSLIHFGAANSERPGRGVPSPMPDGDLPLPRQANVPSQLNGPRPDEDPDLTERQMEILRLMARGLTNAQIAKRVGFSDSTVRQETMAIYRRFGVSGRHEAIHLAAARGMLNTATVASA